MPRSWFSGVSAARGLRLAACLLVAALTFGCASAPQRSDELARQLGFTKNTLLGQRFRHVVYRNDSMGSSPLLHVYIEGDGTPFESPRRIAAEPTSADPLMLRLMGSDRENSIDLGRPCYFGLSRDPGCSPLYWTARRYSHEILDSMEAALRAEAARVGATQVELFGHSGGGSLAVLLAQRMTVVARVVTIGPNLDIDAWCRLHHYSPLVGSLNPAAMFVNGRQNLKILHLVGEQDTNTPPGLVRAAAANRGGEEVRTIPGYTHNCCWAALWPEILAEQSGK